MTRPFRAFHKGMAVLAALVLLAGCVEPPKKNASVAGVHALPRADGFVPVETNAPPEAGYAWHELARRAAANCDKARILLFDAEAERLEAALDTAWRDPQLKYGRTWGDQDSFSSDRRYDKRASHNDELALRVYTSNPFVNRWVRRRGESAARALEAEAREEAFAVFCEVRLLCLEAEMLREDLALLAEIAGVRAELHALLQEKADAGVGSPLDVVLAETRTAALRTEIREREVARRKLLRRIAVLADVTDEPLRLHPRVETVVDGTIPEAAELVGMAFARRPDLERFAHEHAAAEHELNAARANLLPWFEYVEGSYDSGYASTWEHGAASAERSVRDETDWQLRIAVSVPVFSWLGNETTLSKARLAIVAARMSRRYEQVRNEVNGLLADYHAARETFDTIVAEYRRTNASATHLLEELADEPAVKQEDMLAVREELVSYRRSCLKAVRECLRLKQYLETVSGGPLDGWWRQ